MANTPLPDDDMVVVATVQMSGAHFKMIHAMGTGDIELGFRMLLDLGWRAVERENSRKKEQPT